MFEYNNICSDLLSDLPERTRDIIVRRFGLGDKEKETLEVVGKGYGITRERVRQIERDGIKEVISKSKKNSSIFSSFSHQIDRFGGLKREDRLVSALSKERENYNHILFLLGIGDGFERVSETEEIHSLWMSDRSSLSVANEVIEHTYKLLTQKRTLLSVDKIDPSRSISVEKIISYLEISKKVSQTNEGFFGLKNWPEITPRGIKDRAYLALKKEKTPLHFKKVSQLIGRETNDQTVHNELIKDNRFVLVGRGVYALSEWGYAPGEVKDVIYSILEKEGPLSKKEIMDRVLEQRMVKKNTIIQNLSNKKRFARSNDGKYTLA